MVVGSGVIGWAAGGEKKGGTPVSAFPFFFSHRQPARCLCQLWSATGGAVRTTLTPTVVAHGYGVRLITSVELITFAMRAEGPPRGVGPHEMPCGGVHLDSPTWSYVLC